jgi:hypothetical protein
MRQPIQMNSPLRRWEWRLRRHVAAVCAAILPASTTVLPAETVSANQATGGSAIKDRILLDFRPRNKSAVQLDFAGGGTSTAVYFQPSGLRVVEHRTGTVAVSEISGLMEEARTGPLAKALSVATHTSPVEHFRDTYFRISITGDKRSITSAGYIEDAPDVLVRYINKLVGRAASLESTAMAPAYVAAEQLTESRHRNLTGRVSFHELDKLAAELKPGVAAALTTPGLFVGVGEKQRALLLEKVSVSRSIFITKGSTSFQVRVYLPAAAQEVRPAN